jgi:hypothetical protein
MSNLGYFSFTSNYTNTRGVEMLKYANYAKHILLILIAVLSQPMNAQATPIIQTYYLENVRLAGGGIVTGQFTFDNTQFEDYATNYFITVSGVSASNFNGTLDATNSIIHLSSGVGPSLFQIINNTGAGTVPGFITLQFQTPLDTLPLVAPLLLYPAGFTWVNNNGASATELVISGDVTTINPNMVPEPTAIALVASGLIGFSILRKKPHKV